MQTADFTNKDPLIQARSFWYSYIKIILSFNCKSCQATADCSLGLYILDIYSCKV